MGEKRHHHWKIWLTLILILGIVGLLLYTDAGKKTLSLFKIPQFIKTTPTPTGTQFSITLNSNIEAFYSQVYAVTNSTFVANGICEQPMEVLGRIRGPVEQTRCDIVIPSFSGTVDYTAGIMKLSGETNSVVLDGDPWSSQNPEKIEIEIIPFNLLLTDLTQNKISLPSVSGDITCSKDDKIMGVGYPSNSTVTISNFAGSLKLGNETAILSGTTNSVKVPGFTCG